MNKHADEEVKLLLYMTKLLSNLKPKNNQLLMKIVKGFKDATEHRICNNDNIDDTRVTIPDNVSDLKRHCLKNAYSILKNVPAPKCSNYSHIANSSAEELIKYVLLIGSSITMLDPEHIKSNASKI